MSEDEIEDFMVECSKCGQLITSKGQVAYELRQKGLNWDNIKERIGGGNPLNLAKFYAKVNGKQWPLTKGRVMRRVKRA